MVSRAQDHQLNAASALAPLTAWWLGRTLYRDAWDLQHRLVAARLEGLIGDQLLLLEHEPVLTLGRHGDLGHVLATQAELRARRIELIRVERGGEVTYHGPGQLTAYPIIRIADRDLMIRPLVTALESALAAACAAFGVEAGPRAGYPGCWTGGGSRKIGAVGLRIEHGVSYHGLALNVTASMADFELIDACGLPGVESTSVARERGETGAPTTDSVARAAAAFGPALADALGAALRWAQPPAADPVAARAALEGMLAAATTRAGTTSEARGAANGSATPRKAR